MRPPVRGFRPQQPRAAADPSATRPAFINNSGSEPNSPAPLGAPAALVLSGLLGFVAERVRDNEPGTPVTVFGRPAGRVMAAVTAAGLVGTVGEAGLLHFRGAYHDPAML